jgi:hypothetical protein
LNGLVGNIKGVVVDSRSKEGRGRGREEEKSNGYRCQTRNTFGPCMAPSLGGVKTFQRQP